MNGHRYKHLDLVDLNLVRGSSQFEEGTSSESEEIVEGIGTHSFNSLIKILP